MWGRPAAAAVRAVLLPSLTVLRPSRWTEWANSCTVMSSPLYRSPARHSRFSSAELPSGTAGVPPRPRARSLYESCPIQSTVSQSISSSLTKIIRFGAQFKTENSTKLSAWLLLTVYCLCDDREEGVFGQVGGELGRVGGHHGVSEPRPGHGGSHPPVTQRSFVQTYAAPPTCRPRPARCPAGGRPAPARQCSPGRLTPPSH